MKKNKRKMKEKPYNNLIKSERKLSEREDIIIAKADKGGAVVIVDVKGFTNIRKNEGIKAVKKSNEKYKE